MKVMRGLLLAGALMLAPAAFAQAKVCTETGPACMAVLKNHLVKSRAYWEPALAKPLMQRIGPAPDEVVDFITQDNIMHGFPNRPLPSRMSPEFLRDVEQALAELPAPVHQRLKDKLAGIYFAVDFGGTGFTDAVADADGNESIGFIVLDSAVLSARVANAWATWKENTPFSPEAEYTLVAEIEDASDNDRKNAIQFILLHELGHILSIGEQIHPPWTIPAKEVGTIKDLAYFSLSWATPGGNEHFASLFDDRFPQRKDIVYYFGAKLSRERAADIYDKLEATNFPTLYAATSPGDDWAEGFATYVHTVMMNKPFSIRIYRDQKLIKEYSSCWAERRCAGKRKIIERFLGQEELQPSARLERLRR
jgi:hypothetical protein